VKNLLQVERAAKASTLYLLKRSFDLMQEQDNRVKRANGVILATKCRAIRNAQIAEKEVSWGCRSRVEMTGGFGS
jgi:hypothetical protein